MGREGQRELLIQQMAIDGEATRVSNQLTAAGVRFVVLKGPWLAELWRREDRVRTYGDVDILVTPHDLPRTQTLLLEGGQRHIVDNPMNGVVVLGRSGGSLVDLQVSVVHEPVLARSFRLDTEDLLRNRRLRPTADGLLPVLSSVDNLLHVCVHALRSDPYRLSYAMDVHCCASYDEIDWEEFIARARRTGCSLIAAVMLDRAQWLCSTWLPDGLVNKLAPLIGWRGLVRSLSRTTPNAQFEGARGSFGRIASATRDTSMNSLLAALRPAP